MRIKQPSRLRCWFERWLARKFIVRYGPVLFRSRDSWVFIDYYGDRYRLNPTFEPGNPLTIVCEEKQ